MTQAHSRNTPEFAAPLPFWGYALHDFLEMRTGMRFEERLKFIQLLQKRLSPTGEILTLPAFLLGDQVVLCVEDFYPETCWLYNRKTGELKTSRG